MALPRLEIDPDVARASTLPSEVYAGEDWFRAVADRVLSRAWLPVGDEKDVAAPRSLAPVEMLPGVLDVPLLLARDEAGTLRCLSNVCTHRGNVLVDGPCEAATVRCGYHGRRFALDGRFLSMPRSEGIEGFPAPADDLPRVPLGRFEALLFAALDPATAFDAWIAPARDLARRLDPARWVADPAGSREFEVEANWALYVDNYLEGFHVPFLHAGLAEALDPGAYDVVPLPLGVLQVGYAAAGGPSIPVPPGPRGEGRAVAAAWLWLFPTTMLNFYPWGLSVNVVRPLGPRRTRVSFSAYVGDAALRREGAGGDLDRVEAEDEAVVGRVQRGVRSRLYRRGRYAPLEEAGVHRFHRLLAAALNGDPLPPRTESDTLLTIP